MKAKPWKKLSSTEILRHPRMHLLEDTVELPNGKTTQYIRHSAVKAHAVTIIAINDKQEMLVQKEYSYPPNKVLWQLPGGAMLQGEDVIAAANRELSEESDLIAGNCEEIGFFYMDSRRSDAKLHVVVGTNLKRQVGRRDDEEFIETHWIPVEKLRTMIRDGEFDHAFLLAALSLYFAKKT